MAKIVVMGIFVADATFQTDRLPVMGETLIGHGFTLGPGGKGSNQAIAAARLGGEVTFLTKLGDDAFAQMADQIWREAGVQPEVRVTPDTPTGAAGIMVNRDTGDNAIVVAPGAAGTLSAGDAEGWREHIAGADVFVVQLEQPLEAAEAALQLARSSGAVTILNPAPAAEISDAMIAACDYLTPNETEAEALTGLPVTSLEQAFCAAEALRQRGAGGVVVTLGAQGAILLTDQDQEHIPAFDFGPAVDTTGAGDAFNGAFAVALAEGQSPVEAVTFGCRVASLSVTRRGAGLAMPTREEIMDSPATRA